MAFVGSGRLVPGSILFESASIPVPAPARPRLGDYRDRLTEHPRSGVLGGDTLI